MAKIRSFKQQFKYALYESYKKDESKHSAKNDERGLEGKIFSTNRLHDLIDLSNQLGDFISENYEIKKVAEINSEMMNDFLEMKEETCNSNTLFEYKSRINKISECCNSVYKNHDINFEPTKNYEKDNFKIRDKSMESEDLDILKQSLGESGNIGELALEIAERTGMRAREIAELRQGDINVEDGIVEVRKGAKGGNFRDIPMKENDMEFWKNLSDKKITNDNNKIFGNKTEDTINKDIRYHMKKNNLHNKYENTTIHSVRKMYAKEEFERVLKEIKEKYNDKNIDNEDLRILAWENVQQKLGHGSVYRYELFDTYMNAM